MIRLFLSILLFASLAQAEWDYIREGDSKVQCTDTGTGSCAVTIDGSVVSTFNSSGLDCRIYKADSYFEIVDSGAGVAQFYIDGNRKLRISASAINSDIPFIVSNYIQFDGASGSTSTLKMNTSDASDNKYLVIGGGGEGLATRGAFIRLAGNEEATYLGTMILTAGDVSNSIRLDSKLQTKEETLQIPDSGGAGTATYTLQPTRSLVLLDCQDADGCDITLSETNAHVGDSITIVGISTNVSNFSDTTGTSELAGSFAMGIYDSLTIVYGTDRWFEKSRSNN